MSDEQFQDGELIFYRTDDGVAKVEVLYLGDTFWLNQKRIAELFGVDLRTISYHLGEIYASGELKQDATLQKIRIVQSEGNRQVSREIEHYNLDAIISVGYRVNSSQATAFRIWATQTLKEFIIKGFVLDDERLKLNKRFGHPSSRLVWAQTRPPSSPADQQIQPGETHHSRKQHESFCSSLRPLHFTHTSRSVPNTFGSPTNYTACCISTLVTCNKARTATLSSSGSTITIFVFVNTTFSGCLTKWL